MQTDQEVFDAVARHLAAQGCRAGWGVNSYVFQCRYRTEWGDKCAIGALIPDDNYEPSLEGQPGNSDVVMEAAGLALGGDNQRHLLGALQETHDLEDNWSHTAMPTVLTCIGWRFALDVSILDRLDFGLILPSRLDR